MKIERERRWFVLERPRRDTNGGRETEVTVELRKREERDRYRENRFPPPSHSSQTAEELAGSGWKLEVLMSDTAG